MAKKILLAAGCSYTEKTFFSRDNSLSDIERGGWSMWPEIMAKELDLECVNIGQSGAGNDFIFNELVEAVNTYRDKIDTIAILWTGAERQNFFTWLLNAPVELNLYLDERSTSLSSFEWLDEIGIGAVNAKYWSSTGFDDTTYKWIIDNYICKLSAAVDIAESRGVKLVMMQGVAPLDFWTYRELHRQGKINAPAGVAKAAQNFIQNPAIHQLEKNKEKFIGWPIFTNLGGFYIDSLMSSENKISDNDGHPNAAGQKQIADLFLERHNNVYGKLK